MPCYPRFRAMSQMFLVLTILAFFFFIYLYFKLGERYRPEPSPATDIYSLLDLAQESGYAEGTVIFVKDACLADYLPGISWPCNSTSPGVQENEPYCFERGGAFEVTVTKNDAGGLCIYVEEIR